MVSEPILKDWWIITVGGGYGSFAFKGSERAAEEMRVHKARWEGAVANKRPACHSDEALVADETAANKRAGKRGSAWRLG